MNTAREGIAILTPLRIRREGIGREIRRNIENRFHEILPEMLFQDAEREAPAVTAL
ncbi:MAG: hypothetical protein UU78_C0085G0001, partial [Candidatus Roizmanbacteria bacterium GW2011_GWC2_41_7]